MEMTENDARVADLLQRYCPEGVVLDLPCGRGGLCDHLQEEGYEVVPADIGPSVLELPDTQCQQADLKGKPDLAESASRDVLLNRQVAIVGRKPA